jgi:hypothetical protein
MTYWPYVFGCGLSKEHAHDRGKHICFTGQIHTSSVERGLFDTFIAVALSLATASSTMMNF